MVRVTGQGANSSAAASNSRDAHSSVEAWVLVDTAEAAVGLSHGHFLCMG